MSDIGNDDKLLVIIHLFYILAHLFSQGHCDIIYISFAIFSVEKVKVLTDAIKFRSCMVNEQNNN